MTGSRLRAVLFDMDGTLVETEEYWGEAMHALAARLGGRMSSEARARTVGSSMAVSMGILYADLGVARTPEQQAEDVAGIESAVADMLARTVRWQPGARELLATVRAAGLRTALVTTTGRALADLVLAHMGAAFDGESPFELTVCGDEVPARKPDPAPYLQAMRALGVQPDECLVVEDSVAGVTSGLAAGAAVLGVAGMQAVPPAPGLTQVDSLVGLGIEDLRAAAARRADAETAAR